MKTIQAAKVIIRVGDDFLLLRNSPTHPRWPGYNDLPGGTQEPGELIEETAVRETLEETTVKLMPNSITLVHASTLKKPDVYIIYLLYAASLEGKSPLTLSYEHDQYAWVKRSELKNLEPHYQESIDYLIENDLL